MDLYLLRHGIPADHGLAPFPDDPLRPLDARGEKQVGEIAKALSRLDLGIDTIWCSPFVRTLETARAVATTLGLEGQLETRDELAPGGDPGKLLADLDALEPGRASVMLVGHEPYLSRLLSVIASGGPNVGVEIKKGGMARLDITRPIGLKQCAVLQWLLPPRLLTKTRP